MCKLKYTKAREIQHTYAFRRGAVHANCSRKKKKDAARGYEKVSVIEMITLQQ